MAKIPHDRENLLQDGRAMPVRGRIRIRRSSSTSPISRVRVDGPPDDAPPNTGTDTDEIVIGWRQHGQASWFCNLDPVFQFSSDGKIRRAFWNGVRISAENGKLYRLVAPAPSSPKLKLSRAEMSPENVADLMRNWNHWRSRVESVIRFPEDSDDGSRSCPGFCVETVGCERNQFLDRLSGWLDTIPHQPLIAESAHA